MKTLINKHNPAIRITAPEITTEEISYGNYQYVYWIPTINEMYNPIDWTLVEEEPPMDLEKDWCPVENEPVELEKEIKEWITPPNPSIDPKKETISGELHINCIIATARHFYELGKKGGNK